MAVKVTLISILASPLLVGLSVIAHGQPSNQVTSCTNKFPYGPKKFLEKLVAVAEEADPYSVPGKFQLIFGMKFSVADVKDAQSFFYAATACEWYTHVQIGTSSNLKVSGGTRVFLSVGEFQKPLRFSDAHRDECLSREVASNSIVAAGWTGGAIETPVVFWAYGKDHMRLEIMVKGGTTPNGVMCVTEILVRYQ